MTRLPVMLALAVVVVACAGPQIPMPAPLPAPQAPELTGTPAPTPAGVMISARPSVLPPTSPPDIALQPTATPPLHGPRPPFELGPLEDSGWLVAAHSTGPADYAAHWSPDARHFLLERGRVNGRVDLLAAEGASLRTFDADWATWIDSGRFLLVKLGGELGDAERANLGRIGTLDSEELVDVDLPPGYGPSNGHGAVAFTDPRSRYGRGCGAFGCPAPEFSVWTADGTTRPRPGQVVGWSAAADRLFVIRVDPPSTLGVGAPSTGPTEGWLEVLAWPGLRSIERHTRTLVSEHDAHVEPGGRYLAYRSYQGDSSFLNVVPVSSGRLTSFEAPASFFAWNDDGEIVTSPYQSRVMVHGVDGEVLAEHHVRGRHVVSSPDGSTVVFSEETFGGRRPFVTYLVGGELHEAAGLPAEGYMLSCGRLAVAPDGSALVVVCSYNDRVNSFPLGNEVALLYRLR